jgi:Domain of unknown function (DUF1330)
MAAYVLSEVEVLDEESFERYRELARKSIEQHGGRYLVPATLPEARKEIGRLNDGWSSSSFPIWTPCGDGMRRRNTRRQWFSGTGR